MSRITEKSIQFHAYVGSQNLMLLALTTHKEVNVILADDDEDDRILFKEAMDETHKNVKLSFAENGEELMQKLTDPKLPLPDLIFLDLNMPLKNGQECLEEIRQNKRLRNIPIIIYSTSSSKEHIEQTYQEGANLYIKKPTSFQELKKVTQRVFSLDWDHYLPRPKKENYLLRLKTP